MRIICPKKILNICYCLLFALCCSVCSLFLSYDTNAMSNADDTGTWTNSMHATTSYVTSSLKLNNSDEYSGELYIGCHMTDADLFNNNFYGDGYSRVFNVKYSSRHSDGQTCLYGAGGKIGNEIYKNNRVIMHFDFQGSYNNFVNSQQSPTGIFIGSNGTIVNAECRWGFKSHVPNTTDMVNYEVVCGADFNSFEYLADYEIYFNTQNNFPGAPFYQMSVPKASDIDDRRVYSKSVIIEWYAKDLDFEPSLSDYLDILYKNNLDIFDREEKSIKSQSLDAVETINRLGDQILYSRSTLLQVFTSFVNAIVGANPTHCRIDIDLFDTSAYGVGEAAGVYTVDLCSLNVPPIFGYVGSIVVCGFCVMLSYFSVRLMLNLLRRIV